MLRELTIYLRPYVQSPLMLLGFVAAFAGMSGIYLLGQTFWEMSAKTSWRVFYGILAALLLLAAILYGYRRRTLQQRWGSSQTWLQCHIYGGGIFLLLVLMHSGFRVPSGIITWSLWALSIWMGASGLLGTLLQKWLPKILASGLSIEVIYERIPELIGDIRQKSEVLVRGCEAPLSDFYRRNIATALQGPQPRLIYFFDITGGIQTRMRQFNYLHSLLDDRGKTQLALLTEYYKTKLEIDAHYTLQRALRCWLFLHAPLSLAMIILLIFHLYSIFWY